jgi:hypothetical protein
MTEEKTGVEMTKEERIESARIAANARWEKWRRERQQEEESS